VTHNPGIYRAAAVLLAGLLAQAAHGQVCTEWKDAVHIGDLQLQLEEASGVAVSRKFPNRLYHVNDSGDAGTFYVTNMQGRETRPVSITGFKPRDTEAISLGGCGNGKSCLFIGDVGDNQRRRETAEIVIVEELEQFPASVSPIARMKLRYPDGPHDAESLAVHPDGTIYILTKEQPARLFKAKSHSSSQVLTPVMTLDAGGRPTDMAISDDGTRLLVLTYLDAVEFGIDFQHPEPLRYRQTIHVRFLQQQEGVAYLPGSRSFVYTTERLVFPAWVMRVDCGGNQGHAQK